MVYNTLTRKKEEFKPINDGIVNMYVCGVTVYDHCHLGHVKAAISFDIITRYLKYKGYDVNYIVNITDVGHLMGDIDEGEDKIAKRAQERKIVPMELVDTYIKSMWEDLDRFEVLRPNIAPRATGHLIDMIDIIKKLIENGYAYEVNGSVYFDLDEFLKRNPNTDYGKLSGRKLEEEISGVRVEVDQNKKNPYDFVLWKKAEPEHLMKWTSPWSKGYPGWHLECSTMASKYLGQPFDIHGGGIEHTNLHHECEIAQAEGAEGKKFVNYWLHCGMLNVEGQKMSKSIGNFITLKEILKHHDYRTIRLLMAQCHYRSELNYTNKSIEDAERTLERLDNFVTTIQGLFENPSSNDYNEILGKLIKDTKNSFEKAMDNDFDSPTAMSVFFQFITEINKYITNKEIDKKNVREIYEFLQIVDRIFMILKMIGEKTKDTTIDKDFIDNLIEVREFARENKNWDIADKLRDALKGIGIYIEDTKDGVVWKKKG